MAAQTTMSRKRVLIVDDSVIILKTLSMKLKSSGYDVLTAADGGTAVSMVRREKPDPILLDINFAGVLAKGVASNYANIAKIHLDATSLCN